MDAFSLAPEEKLPEDVPTLQALLRQALVEMAPLRAENAERRGKVDAALKHRFGRRSERQLTTVDAKQNKPGRAKPHGRASLPASLDYPAAGPERFLRGYRGYWQADALAPYEGLYGEDKIRPVCCWAHARRKFVAAREGGAAGAQAALEWIGPLYAIERELLPLLPPGDDAEATQQRRQREEQRKQWRQLQAGPVRAALKQWLQEQKGKVLPKSVLAQAVG